MRNVRQPKGFTLIELMIVVAVIGIVAMVAIPKMSNLIEKSNEAGTRGHLGAVRGALRIYYLDNNEVYPTDILPVLAPGSRFYNGVQPTVFTAPHGKRNNINQLTALAPNTDNGDWGYVMNDPLSPALQIGTFWVQCTHIDASGKVWSQY